MMTEVIFAVSFDFYKLLIFGSQVHFQQRVNGCVRHNFLCEIPFV